MNSVMKALSVLVLFMLLASCSGIPSGGTDQPGGGGTDVDEPGSDRPLLPNEVITAENMERLVRIASYGNGALLDIALSRDGKYLAAAAAYAVHVYDASTNQLLLVLETGRPMLCVAFSDDGSLLAAGSYEKIYLYAGWQAQFAASGGGRGQAAPPRWSGLEGAPLTPVEPQVIDVDPHKNVEEVLFPQNPDGLLTGDRLHIMAFMNESGKVGVYNTQNQQQVSSFESGGKYRLGLEFAPNGDLFTWGYETPLTRWDPLTGQSLQTYLPQLPNDYQGQTPLGVGFSPQGDVLYAGYSDIWSDNPIQAYQFQTGARYTLEAPWDTPFTGPEPEIKGLNSFTGSSDGQIYFTDRQNQVYGGDPLNGAPLQYPYTGYFSFSYYTSLQAYPQAVYAYEQTGLSSWQAGAPDSFTSQLGYNGYFYGLGLGNNSLYASSNAGLYYVNEYANNLQAPLESTPLKGLSSNLAYNPENGLLAVELEGAAVKFFDTQQGMQSAGLLPPPLTNEYPMVLDIGFSPDGTQFGVSYDDSTVNIHSLPGLDLLNPLSFMGSTPEEALIATSLSFAPDGSGLALGLGSPMHNQPGQLQVYNFGTQSLLPQPVTLPDITIADLQFNPDSRSLLTSSYEGQVEAWSLSTWQPKLLSESQEGSFQKIAFTPDGRLLATLNKDGTVTIIRYDPFDESGTPLAKHTLQVTGPAQGLSFSPDGRTLAVSAGGQIHTYAVP